MKIADILGHLRLLVREGGELLAIRLLVAFAEFAFDVRGVFQEF